MPRVCSNPHNNNKKNQPAPVSSRVCRALMQFALLLHAKHLVAVEIQEGMVGAECSVHYCTACMYVGLYVHMHTHRFALHACPCVLSTRVHACVRVQADQSVVFFSRGLKKAKEKKAILDDLQPVYKAEAGDIASDAVQLHGATHVFTFCEGWAELDKRKMASKLAKLASFQVWVCIYM